MDSFLKNGECRVLNRKTGKLKLIKNYHNDLLHGEYVYYWDNGNIRFCGEYKHSQRVGLWRNYDKSGEIILEERCEPIRSINRELKINYSQLEKQLVGNESFGN